MQLGLHRFGVGPLTVEVLITIVHLQLLELFLLLMIEAEHLLVRFLIDRGLALGCTGTLGLEFDDELGLLVFAEVVTEELGSHELLGDHPD